MKRLHRPIAFLISLLLLLGTFPFAASAVPPDMPSEEHWAYAALQAAVENGLLFGDKDGNLNPTNNLTRAEMAAVVNRAFAAVNEADISAYNDVPQGAWFYKDVAKAVAMGTFSGDGSGKMHPTNTISRQEVFAVMARAFKLEGNDLSVLDAYSDSASISGWAKSALANMVKAGYIKGSGNKLNPQGQITRQEFAQVMYSMIKTYATSETASAVGNVLVRTPETVLKDLVIEGDLIIAEGVADGVLTLENVTVTGRIVIRSGATLRLNQHSDAEGDILIYAEDATVEADKNSTFDTVIVHSNGADIHASSGDVIVAVDVADTTVNGEPAEGGVTVEIGQDDPLLLALNAANGASYTTDLPLADEEAAVAAVKVIAEAAIDNSDILVSVQVVSYTAAVDGTLAAPDGTDGALVFTLSMNDGGSPATSEEKTLVLPAVPYTAHPSVAVTPAESDIAYKGDITLTAVATDILSPTYQWYRADDADAPGSAIEGETATTLALTDLTKTAYYYCMCGTVKSNAVKVTVAEHPLKDALVTVNALIYSAIAQASCAGQDAAMAHVKALVETAVSDSAVTVTVNAVSYTAPTAGTLGQLAGTNGALGFTVSLGKAGITETVAEKTLTITATAYGEHAVNRGHFLQLLANFSTDVLKFNLNGYVYTDPIYSDIIREDDLSRAAVWCGAWKIMDGRDDGTFGVNDMITRDEIKNTLCQYVTVWLEDSTFTAEKAETIVSTVTPTGEDGAYAPSDIYAILDGVKKYSDENESCNSIYAHMKRGVNIWTWDNSLYGDRISGANTTLYEELWDAGFDHVRLVWDATDVETRDDNLFTYSMNPTTHLYDISLKQDRFNSAIYASNLAEKAGMTAIIDLHGVRFPTNRKNPLDPNEQPQLFIQMWGYFAKNLNSLPDTVMFELCNETFIEGKTVEKAIDAIRGTGGNNATRPIIVYSYHWNVDDNILDIGKYNGDKSIAWDIHNYEPYWFTIGNESVGYDDDGWSIPKYHYTSEVYSLMISRMNCGHDLTEKTGQKVWFGEYGANSASGVDREKYLTAYMDEMLKYGMYSTCYWSLGFYANEDILKPYATRLRLELGSFETTDENGNPKIYWDMDVMRSIFS